MKKLTFFAVLLPVVLSQLFCSNQRSVEFFADFDNVNDRVWIGRDFWAIPMEDWRIRDGRMECIGERNNMRVNLLTHVLSEKEGTVFISVRMGLLEPGRTVGSAGLRIGIVDAEDGDARAACYFGKGLNAGISTDDRLFIETSSTDLPDDFDYGNFTLILEAKPISANYDLTLTALDDQGRKAAVDHKTEKLMGLIALVNHLSRPENPKNAPRFWFDDLRIKGSKIQLEPENGFGPILWSKYTLSRGVLKLSAQMPPLGRDDSQTVLLQLKRGGNWSQVDEQRMDASSRTILFRINDWDSAKETPYRLVYGEMGKNGVKRDYYYGGVIREEPLDRPLVFGGLTCQYGTGFPYSPLVKNLTRMNPDILYFSGDQIYEGNGGYNIIRFPAEKAILDYLGKWYMFGWAFGDLMRDRPTICTPDDHDVFQGNLWGEGGRKISLEEWERYEDAIGGYVQPAEMVNVVHRTQCSQLPDPFDPTPIEQGIEVWYTDLVYGRVSFAIVSDRMFKSSPRKVAFWQGGADHLTEKLPDMSVLDRPDLKLLGERQLGFLQEWIVDWRGADMKVVLSQTVFANIATHHGEEQMVLFADLDSGGWPKSARDRALHLMRKAFVFHIVGDQHLPSLSQYGINDYRDSGWCFCTPAIYVGYERRFLPEDLGWLINNPPDHGNPNTGYYEDPFGSPTYVYAVGNPVSEPVRNPRYRSGQEKASGFGIVRFDRVERTITVEAYHFLADLTTGKTDAQFPGWPHVIDQFDNYGRQASGYLPEIMVNGVQNPVLYLTNETTGELEYAVRLKGNQLKPKVFSDDRFTVKVGDPDLDRWKTLSNLTPQPAGTGDTLIVEL